jgi:hypothetical protein
MSEKIDKAKMTADKVKPKLTKPNPDIVILIERKITFFQDTIQRTILHIQKNKILNVINVSEMNKRRAKVEEAAMIPHCRAR